MSPRHFLRALLFSLCLLGPATVAAQALIQVPAQGTLQQAITNVSDGGVIQIAAGTYNAPAGGFVIANQAKRFTVRAAPSATVVLSGNGSGIVLHFTNTTMATGRPVTFENLTFSSGVSAADNFGGAVTMVRAEGTFVGCRFNNNTATSANSGGGAILMYAARALFVDSVFNANTAKRYGGAIGLDSSSVAVHNSQFTGNRVNVPGHFVDSLGGAVFVLNSTLDVTNTRFENNQAGFAGGAIYAYGTWTEPVTTPRTDIVISNSTFVSNSALRDPGSPAFATVDAAGALQLEDQVRARVYNSRFVTNFAKQGGAIANYRSRLEIYGSTFQGNQARGNAGDDGYGGAIDLVSEDQDAPDPQRPNAVMIVRDSMFQGRFGSVTTTGRFGGCIFSVGDTRRAYGLGGIPQTGTIAQNRTVLDIRNSMFVDCDVQNNAGGGVGGGIMTQLSDLTLMDSLLIGCDAFAGAANTGTGGALASFDNSTSLIQRTTIARSTAAFTGAAIWMQGANVDISDSQIIENQLVGPNVWGGAAVYAAPENLGAPRPAVNVTGRFQNNTISNNTGGVVILDFDSASAPHNLVQYAGNRFFPNNSSVYANPLASGVQTVSQLNGLSLHGSPKAPTANTGLSNAPVAGAILAAPPTRLPTVASGDPAGPTASWLGIAWSGGSATLDGVGVGGNFGLVASTVGNHVLSVAGTPYSAAIGAGATPATTLSANPSNVAPGASSLLSWATQAGAFVTEFIDQGVVLNAPAASGSVTASGITATTRYRGLLVAQEGGALVSVVVSVGADTIFSNGFQ